jgi:hypothetical protein
VLDLAGDPHRYYINRGIDLEWFRKRVAGGKVNLHETRRAWSALNPAH